MLADQFRESLSITLAGTVNEIYMPQLRANTLCNGPTIRVIGLLSTKIPKIANILTSDTKPKYIEHYTKICKFTRLLEKRTYDVTDPRFRWSNRLSGR